MKIKSLEQVSLKIIANALAEAFADYFVPMTNDTVYWENRFRIARLDPTLCFGMFDENLLVGFILIGVDNVDGKLTAFNTGTGVLPAYRGKGIVDALYSHALPQFRARSIDQCSLEVIQENHKAIRVYERIGFSKAKLYYCFRGELRPEPENITLKKIDFDDVPLDKRSHYNSWDHTDKAIELSFSYSCFEVLKDEKPAGYFVIDPENGYIPQMNIYNEQTGWNTLFNGIVNLVPEIKVNNVDSRNTILVASLRSNLNNFINQYEMRMDI